MASIARYKFVDGASFKFTYVVWKRVKKMAKTHEFDGNKMKLKCKNVFHIFFYIKNGFLENFDENFGFWVNQKRVS